MPRPPRILQNDFPIHVTGRCNNRENFPVPPEVAWDILGDFLHLVRGEFDLRIFSFVMMSNHFHLLCRDPQLQLARAMHVFMTQTSRELGRLSHRVNKIWGGSYHASVIADQRYFLHSYKYCYRNPVEAGLCARVEDYPWSTLRILLGQDRGHIPLEEDETLFADPEGVLYWLNASYCQDDAQALRRGLRRAQFRLPRSPLDGEARRLEPLPTTLLR